MNIILFVGAMALLAVLGRGAYGLWRAQADQRLVKARLKQYASR